MRRADTAAPPDGVARTRPHRALTGVKQRLKGAKMGYSLLKKKSDALTIKFRAVAKKIMDVRGPADTGTRFSTAARRMHQTHRAIRRRARPPGGRYLPQTKRLMGDVIQEAHFSYAQVVYVAGDVGYRAAPCARACPLMWMHVC